MLISTELVSSQRYKLACAPIKSSEQPAHSRSLIRIYDGHSVVSQEPNVTSGEKPKALIRLCGCAD